MHKLMGGRGYHLPTSSHSLEECCSNVVSAYHFIESTIKDPWSPGVAMGLK